MDLGQSKASFHFAGIHEHSNRLLECLSDPPVENWASIPTPKEFWTTWYSTNSNMRDKGVELASISDFLRELEKTLPDFDLQAVRRYARENFSASDVPQLLTAVRAVAGSDQVRNDNGRLPNLLVYGPFLLVQHGFSDPQVVVELDRVLTDDDSPMLQPTMFAFGYGGAKPFYAYDEWTANLAANRG